MENLRDWNSEIRDLGLLEKVKREFPKHVQNNWKELVKQQLNNTSYACTYTIDSPGSLVPFFFEILD